jgi:sterol 3beta-glucosyltransferase
LDDEDEEESWTFVGGDAEVIDDLTPEAVMHRTVADLSSPRSPGSGRALGSRVLGGAVGEGPPPPPGTGLGLGM